MLVCSGAVMLLFYSGPPRNGVLSVVLPLEVRIARLAETVITHQMKAGILVGSILGQRDYIGTDMPRVLSGQCICAVNWGHCLTVATTHKVSTVPYWGDTQHTR